MDSEVREAILSRVGLAGLVGHYVELSPAGPGRFRGLCPFHQEKTPSFYVDENKGFFYCFGCKAGGDIFSFLQKVEGLNFSESLTKLAHIAGIDLPERSTPDPLREINRVALSYFRSYLGQARVYLDKRRIDPQIAENYQLGFAPAEPDGLLQYLAREGFSPEQGVAAGVLAVRGERVFDRFRERLIFPLYSPSGQLAGFTGRALNPGVNPKYLNTPETRLSKKSELLFGYPEARSALQKTRRALLVEGLFDVLALAQLGYPETVAVLGSSLSAAQAQTLRRIGVNQLYLGFDRDPAGARATLSALDPELVAGFRVAAVLWPPGKDPADLLFFTDPAAAVEAALSEALPETRFRLEAACGGLDLSRPEAKQVALEALLPRWLAADALDPVADELTRLAAEKLGLEVRALGEWVNSRRRQGKTLPPSRLETIGLTHSLKERIHSLELELIAQILQVDPRQAQELAQGLELPEGSLLAEFLRLGPQVNWQVDPLRQHFSQIPGGEVIYARALLGSSDQSELLKLRGRLRQALLEAHLAELKRGLLPGEPTIEILRQIQELQIAIENQRRTLRT